MEETAASSGRPDTGEVESAIRGFIVDHIAAGVAVADLDARQLVEEEILDSLGIFSLVSFLQERFAVEIEPEDVVLANFATIAAIRDLVERRLGGG
jgi:acyl carrier protein